MDGQPIVGKKHEEEKKKKETNKKKKKHAGFLDSSYSADSQHRSVHQSHATKSIVTYFYSLGPRGTVC